MYSEPRNYRDAQAITCFTCHFYIKPPDRTQAYCYIHSSPPKDLFSIHHWMVCDEHPKIRHHKGAGHLSPQIKARESE